MLKKIRHSLSSQIFIIVLTVLLLSGGAMYGIVMIFMPETYRSQITEEFETWFNDLIGEIDVDDMEKSIPIIKDFCTVNKTYIKIMTVENETVFHWQSDKYEDLSQNKTESVISIITGKDGTEYIVMTYAATESVNQVTDSLMRLLPYIVIIILIISTISSWFCSRFIAKPVVQISRISKRISNLDLTWSCDVNREDEIGILADSLNEMARKLDDAIHSLQSANQQLQNEMIQRNQLFTAISHELKTPITIMRCDLEGMIGNIGRYKDRDFYLEHALNTTEAMEKLVREILSVARIESEDSVLEILPADIGELTQLCANDFIELAKERDINLYCDCEHGIISLVDKVHMKKVLSNIISNAIYHSPKGEQVNISLKRKEELGVLMVENTGAAVADEDLSHLFEPFYRADKSRNRHSGGSGLGLFIVKTILDRHGFRYGFSNTERAVRFQICFSIADKR